MSNSLKGEITFEAGGETWTLAYPINSIIALEDELGADIASLNGSQGLKIRTARTMFWAGLLAHHEVTQDEAGDLMDAVGIDGATALIADAMAKAFPQQGGAGKARPRKAPAGTGKPS